MKLAQYPTFILTYPTKDMQKYIEATVNKIVGMIALVVAWVCPAINAVETVTRIKKIATIMTNLSYHHIAHSTDNRHYMPLSAHQSFYQIQRDRM